MHLGEIQEREEAATARYFPDHDESPEYITIALAGEVGEVCNDIKKFMRGDFGWNEIEDRLHKELPDVLIYLVMLASRMNVDLEQAYYSKKEYNDQRFGSGLSTEAE